MAEYDPSTNYVKLHLEWIRANPRFKPKNGLDAPVNGKPHYETYYDQMAGMYRELTAPNVWAHMALRDDVKWKSGARQDINDQVNQMFGITKKEEFFKFFVTFNFAEDLFKPDKVLADVNAYIKKSWIKSVHGAFEYWTENGHHPHFMMVIAVDKYKNKMLDKMKESSLAKYCKNKEAIDVKKAKPCHEDYVSLDKDPKKSEYLEKDILWRIDNNLPSEIKK